MSTAIKIRNVGRSTGRVVSGSLKKLLRILALVVVLTAASTTLAIMLVDHLVNK
jgi:hypothetical protein